ncbi:MAG: MEDS domain-containing protein [Thermoproteota archaeon]
MEGNDDKGYPELYDKISHYTSQNYAVIYAVEADTTQAVRHMSRYGAEVETLVESGALTIVDRNSMYSVEKTDLEAHLLLNSWHSLILKVKRRSDFNGILAIGTAEVFFEHAANLCKLVRYEEMVGKKFEIPLEAICCYSENTISRLSLAEMVAILNAHHSTIHRRYHYREWHPYKIVELARNSLEKQLGTDLSVLIFKTMKLCYKIGDDEIIANPAILEGMLQRILGKNAASAIIANIKEEIRKSILF